MAMILLADTAKIVMAPGPFQGEPIYVQQYWRAAELGLADLDGYAGETLISCFELNEEDHAAHPSLRGVATLAVWSDADGFVHHRAMSAADYETFKTAWTTRNDVSDGTH